MTVEIVRIYEDQVTATFTLINVREWFAASGGTKFSKPIEEMSKEELTVCLTILLVCEEERWHVFQKFNRWSFARRGTTKTMDEKSIMRGLEFNRIINVQFALVGYESGNSQLRATHPASRAYWLFTIS